MLWAWLFRSWSLFCSLNPSFSSVVKNKASDLQSYKTWWTAKSSLQFQLEVTGLSEDKKNVLLSLSQGISTTNLSFWWMHLHPTGTMRKVNSATYLTFIPIQSFSYSSGVGFSPNTDVTIIYNRVIYKKESFLCKKCVGTRASRPSFSCSAETLGKAGFLMTLLQALSKQNLESDGAGYWAGSHPP